MGILQSLATLVFIICIGLYLYYFSRRQQKGVIVRLWVTVVVGLAAGLLSQALGAILGKVQWTSPIFLFGVAIYVVLLGLASRKLLEVLPKHRR